MNDKKINVTISKDAQISLETDNFKGESCVEAIKELFEQFLEIDHFDHTSEFYEKDEELKIEVNLK
jgi:hypothetical protein